jgi:predicted DNA-binding ribbon-helix-helix protein
MATALPDHLAAPNEDSERHSALVVRNVSVRGRRTSIRFEPLMWDLLVEICRREFCTPHDVCSYADERRSPHGSLASSLRVFIAGYFHTSSTENGHSLARHGQGMFMSQQQERRAMRAMKADALDQKPPDGLTLAPQRTRSGPRL